MVLKKGAAGTVTRNRRCRRNLTVQRFGGYYILRDFPHAMMHETEMSLLRDFFSCYFHEDWSCDAESPDAVVAAYRISRVTEQHLQALGNAILHYSSNSVATGNWRTIYFLSWAAIFAPSGANLSSSQWLRKVASQLLGRCPN